MLLTIDIGNTRIKLGIFQGNNLIKKISIPPLPLHPIVTFRDNISGAEENIAEKYREIIYDFLGETNEIEGTCICCVARDVLDILIFALSKITSSPVILVNHEIKTGLDLTILDTPQTLGADRIAGAAGAFHIYNTHREGSHSPICVIDFGTATTINVINSEGMFMGGAILPGIDMMAKSLHENTASLPLVELREPIKGYSTPLSLPAKNTITSIVSGVIIGTAGAVNRIIREIERETGFNLSIIITGGNALKVKPYLTKENIIEPDLTLKGLNVIFNLNK